jgi:hypothetical protein
MRRYDTLLRAAPPQTCSGDTLEAVLRFRPRIFTVPTEPFALRDVVAIIHPEQAVIAYHLFWEDDIEFPADQEPCDHELCWLVYDPELFRARRFLTYYHGRALEGEMHEDGFRPSLYVQWGKHGSLPAGWEHLGGGTVRGDMREAYRRLSRHGVRNADHPLSRDWPNSFAGSWEAFTQFTEEIDPVGFLSQGSASYVTRFANATIMRYVLRYNFAAKIEWPDTLPLVRREGGPLHGAEPEMPMPSAVNARGAG